MDLSPNLGAVKAFVASLAIAVVLFFVLPALPALRPPVLDGPPLFLLVFLGGALSAIVSPRSWPYVAVGFSVAFVPAVAAATGPSDNMVLVAYTLGVLMIATLSGAGALTTCCIAPRTGLVKPQKPAGRGASWSRGR